MHASVYFQFVLLERISFCAHLVCVLEVLSTFLDLEFVIIEIRFYFHFHIYNGRLLRKLNRHIRCNAVHRLGE